MNDDLTTYQRNVLFQLVKYQQDKTKNVDIVFIYKKLNPFGAFHITVEGDNQFCVDILPEFFNVWIEKKYIAVTDSSIAVNGLPGARLARNTFILDKKSMDYEAFMRQPKLLRIIIVFWEKLIDDVPSLVWGIIGAVLIEIILRLLGLQK